MYRPYPNFPADSRPLRDVQSLLRELTQDFATSFNTGNYDQAASMFSQDGTLMAPHYEGVSGQKPVEQLLRRLGEAGYCNLRMETTRVEHSGDMAMELGLFSVALQKNAVTALRDAAKSAGVWRRLAVWMLLAACWTRNPVAAH